MQIYRGAVQTKLKKLFSQQNHALQIIKGRYSYANYIITNNDRFNTNIEIFTFIAAPVSKLLRRKIWFINRKDNRNC